MPLKGKRVEKLACPLLSRLARRERMFLQGLIKGQRQENFPGNRIGPPWGLTREHAVI